jgi:hypothetical protein
LLYFLILFISSYKFLGRDTMKLKKILIPMMFALLIIIFRPVTASAVGTWGNSVWVGNGYQTSGSNVYIAQKILVSAGYGPTIGTVDGKYGPKTISAIKKYQAANGLSVDGLVGTNTWNKFNSKLRLDFAGTHGSAWYFCYYCKFYTDGSTAWSLLTNDGALDTSLQRR